MLDFAMLTDTSAAATLHAQIFDESERGVRAFYTPGVEREIHGVFDGDALVSVLNFFSVSVNGAPCVYMAGVCTHPDYQADLCLSPPARRRRLRRESVRR